MKFLKIAAQASRIIIVSFFVFAAVVSALVGGLAAAGHGTADPTGSLLSSVLMAAMAFGL